MTQEELTFIERVLSGAYPVNGYDVKIGAVTIYGYYNAELLKHEFLNQLPNTGSPNTYPQYSYTLNKEWGHYFLTYKYKERIEYLKTEIGKEFTAFNKSEIGVEFYKFIGNVALLYSDEQTA